MVNDASTDKSLEVCRQYAARDSRIIIIDKPKNEGIELARNSGYEIASGEYVMHIDADDWLDHKRVVTTMYRKAEETGADYVEIGMQRVMDRHKLITQKCASPRPIMIEQPELFDKYFLSFFGVNILSVNIWGKLYRKSKLDSAGIKPAGVSMGEDLAYNIQLFPHLEKIYISDEIGYNYRLGGMTGHYNSRLLPDLKQLYMLKEELIARYRYYKAYDWVRIELKNVLKTDICQRIAYGVGGGKAAVIDAVSAEITDPIYSKLVEIDSTSTFWEDPFVKAFMSKDAAAMYAICRSQVQRDYPKRILKKAGFKVLNLI